MGKLYEIPKPPKHHILALGIDKFMTLLERGGYKEYYDYYETQFKRASLC
jgi:hypothetical protein